MERSAHILDMREASLLLREVWVLIPEGLELRQFLQHKRLLSGEEVELTVLPLPARLWDKRAG